MAAQGVVWGIMRNLQYGVLKQVESSIMAMAWWQEVIVPDEPDERENSILIFRQIITHFEEEFKFSRDRIVKKVIQYGKSIVAALDKVYFDDVRESYIPQPIPPFRVRQRPMPDTFWDSIPLGKRPVRIKVRRTPVEMWEGPQHPLANVRDAMIVPKLEPED